MSDWGVGLATGKKKKWKRGGDGGLVSRTESRVVALRATRNSKGEKELGGGDREEGKYRGERPGRAGSP